MTDRGYAAIDYSGLVFLVLAALLFAYSWYNRAFTFAHGRRDDEEASRALLAAPESRIASRSVEEKMTPFGRSVLVAVFFILTVMMVAAPIATYMVAKHNFDHVSPGYRYPNPQQQQQDGRQQFSPSLGSGASGQSVRKR